MLMWNLIGAIEQVGVLLESVCGWCSGRDSDPGLRLERPEYLTGLYYRSAFLMKHHANVVSLE
jgi:hypothetical protein